MCGIKEELSSTENGNVQVLILCHAVDNKIIRLNNKIKTFLHVINSFAYQMSAPRCFVITYFWIANEHVKNADSVNALPNVAVLMYCCSAVNIFVFLRRNSDGVCDTARLPLLVRVGFNPCGVI